jgi:hypothetical protein
VTQLSAQLFQKRGGPGFRRSVLLVLPARRRKKRSQTLSSPGGEHGFTQHKDVACGTYLYVCGYSSCLDTTHHAPKFGSHRLAVLSNSFSGCSDFLLLADWITGEHLTCSNCLEKNLLRLPCFNPVPNARNDIFFFLSRCLSHTLCGFFPLAVECGTCLRYSYYPYGVRCR